MSQQSYVKSCGQMNLPVFTVKKGELATMMELKRAVDNIISDKKVNLYRVLSYWHAKELVSERGIFWSHTTNNVPISTLKTRVPVYDLTFPELAEHKLNCPSFLGFDHGDHLDLTLSGAQTFIFLIKYAYAKHNPDESIYLANVAVALAILLLNHDYEMFPLPASFTRMVILAHIRNKADWSTWPEMKAYIDVASNQLDSLLYCLRLDRRYYTGSDNLFNQQDLDQLWLGLLSSITPCVLYNNTIPDGSEQEKDHLWFYRHHESLINAELQSLRFDHGTDDDVDLDALRQQHQNAVYAPDHASNEEDESQASISDRHVDFVAEAQLNADSEHTLPSFVERNGVKAMRGSGHVPAFVLTREVKTDLDLEDLDVGLKLAEKVYPDDQKVTETSSVKDMHLRDDFPSWTKEIFAQQCRSVKPYVAQMVARFNAISRPTAIALARNREELSRFVLSSVDLIRDAHTTRRPVLLEVETAATHLDPTHLSDMIIAGARYMNAFNGDSKGSSWLNHRALSKCVKVLSDHFAIIFRGSGYDVLEAGQRRLRSCREYGTNHSYYLTTSKTSLGFINACQVHSLGQDGNVEESVSIILERADFFIFKRVFGSTACAPAPTRAFFQPQSRTVDRALFISRRENQPNILSEPTMTQLSFRYSSVDSKRTANVINFGPVRLPNFATPFSSGASIPPEPTFDIVYEDALPPMVAVLPVEPEIASTGELNQENDDSDVQQF